MEILFNEKLYKIEKMFLHSFQKIMYLLGQKENLATIEEEKRGFTSFKIKGGFNVLKGF